MWIDCPPDTMVFVLSRTREECADQAILEQTFFGTRLPFPEGPFETNYQFKRRNRRTNDEITQQIRYNVKIPGGAHVDARGT